MIRNVGQKDEYDTQHVSGQLRKSSIYRIWSNILLCGTNTYITKPSQQACSLNKACTYCTVDRDRDITDQAFCVAWVII